ncbi:hypothetical protein FACS1894127_1050 [Clostridia bacterium]|nr:hypothetical protein FACS1894127_1050 [Clostridia bacterium]
MFDIKESLKNLPDTPGVYLHKDSYGEIIYVGKAASLKNRVRQYFQSSRGMDPKVRAMVSHIAEFEYITTNTEMEALILENNLIKKYLPRYNVLLRDDKTYPYIKITLAEEYPRVLKTRIINNDGSKYFGPYADVKSANQVIELLCDVYRLKRCPAQRFPQGHRPCLNFDINRCRGICRMDVSRDEYMASINSIVAFLNGKGRELTDYLQDRMKSSAESLNFEDAAVCRDLLGAANSILEKQRVVLLSGGDMDVVLAAKGEKSSHVVVFFLRDGRLSGRESHHLITNPEDEPKDMVSAFLKQYYINQSQIPKELLVEEALPDNGLIEEWLSGLRGGNVRVFVPQKGDKKALLELARKDIRNVALLLDEKAKSQREKDEVISSALMEIIKGLGAAETVTTGVALAGAVATKAVLTETQVLVSDVGAAGAATTETRSVTKDGATEAAAETKEPGDSVTGADLAESQVLVSDVGATAAAIAEKTDILRIEAYDISNIQGVDSVGAMVVYMGNRPSRKDYRRFKIKTVDGADDYSSMQEVIYRRMKRWATGDSGFSPLPDLILLDGGRGHVNAISLVLKAMNLDIPVAGMVKDDKHRSRGLIYKGEEIDLKKKPVVYHFIGNVQEEVHRFAIEYHHGMRGKTMIRSELDNINGIGTKRRNALLTHFGSLDKIKTASMEELLRVQGMNQAAAKSIQEYFVKDSIEKGDQ